MLSEPSKTVVAPGVYDGITARLALASGAECLYMVHRFRDAARNNTDVIYRQGLVRA
jgi:hypothetical protein